MKRCTAIIDNVIFYSILDAQNEGLIRLTKWLRVDSSEVQYLVSEQQRIGSDFSRTTMLVQDNWRISLWVNAVAPDLPEEEEFEDR